MKKHIYLLLVTCLVTVLAIGQSQRLVLVEEATNASCGPCASQNPAFDALLQSNPDKLVAIKYHWYFPGYDPMHNHNTEENNARVSYYGINGVPHALLDGVSLTGSSYTGAPANCTQAKIDAAYAVPSSLEISMSHEIDNGFINVAMLIKATEAASGTLRARMVVVEKQIQFSSPPGSNGESLFHDVMKKMLPDQNGTELPSFEVGEYVILQGSWEYQNVYDINELDAVGFVQDNASKGVLQAAKSSTTMFSPLFSTDAEILKIDNIAQSYCIGNMQPVVTFRNNGSNDLTSLDITYTISNEEPVVYQWTGNLGFLESEVVTLPEIDFGVIDMNTLNVTLSNPNGQADDYPSNDVKMIDIPKAYDAPNTIVLILKLDDNPEETTWEFTNSMGDVLYSGGPYSTAGQQLVEQLSFDQTDCNTFTIYDAGGDGLTGGGSFAVGFGTSLIAQGNAFGDMATGQFIISITDVDEDLAEQSVKVFPNPVKDVLNVQLNLLQQEQVQYSVIDPMGRVILKKEMGLESPGQKEYNLDLSEMNAGIYYLTLEVGNRKSIEKIVITK